MSKIKHSLYRLKRFAIAQSSVRFMADSADPNGIPSWFDTAKYLVAGYDTGYVWSVADWGKFERAREVHIVDLDGVYEGDVFDARSSDNMTAIIPFVNHRRAAGYFRPTIRAEASDIPAVREAAGSLVPGVDYDIWAVSLTGTPHQAISEGPGKTYTCPVVQYVSHTGYSESVVYDPSWPHSSSVHPLPNAAPATTRHVATGDYSLAEVAVAHGTTSQLLAKSTTTASEVGSQNLSRFRLYYDPKGGAKEKMPKGLVYYSPKAFGGPVQL